MSPRASSLAAFSSSSSSDAMYYDRHSNLELCFDAAEDDFRLRRLYHEMPDRMGYLPSYRNYSVIAPEFLHPLSRDYLQRKEEARRLRMHYKPFDTRSALADDILRRASTPGEEASFVPLLRKNRFGADSAPSVCLSRYGIAAIAEARYPGGNDPPPNLSPVLKPEAYLVRAKTPGPEASKEEDKEEKEVGGKLDRDLPVDIVPVRPPSYTSVSASAASAAGHRAEGDGTARVYYTDTNFPEHFWESAPSLKDMIIKH